MFKINKFSILLIIFLPVYFFVITYILIKLISYKSTTIRCVKCQIFGI